MIGSVGFIEANIDCCAKKFLIARFEFYLILFANNRKKHIINKFFKENLE